MGPANRPVQALRYVFAWMGPPTDLCKHYDTFLLGWVPPTDLCKHYDAFLFGCVLPMDLNKYYDAFLLV